MSRVSLNSYSLSVEGNQVDHLLRSFPTLHLHVSNVTVLTQIQIENLHFPDIKTDSIIHRNVIQRSKTQRLNYPSVIQTTFALITHSSGQFTKLARP